MPPPINQSSLQLIRCESGFKIQVVTFAAQSYQVNIGGCVSSLSILVSFTVIVRSQVSWKGKQSIFYKSLKIIRHLKTVRLRAKHNGPKWIISTDGRFEFLYLERYEDARPLRRWIVRSHISGRERGTKHCLYGCRKLFLTCVF